MKIKLTVVTIIPSGVALRLTPEQAESRRHFLEPFGVKKGVYVGTQPMQFKAGEIIDVVGDLPKGILPVYDQAQEKQPAVKVEKTGNEAADISDSNGNEELPE